MKTLQIVAAAVGCLVAAGCFGQPLRVDNSGIAHLSDPPLAIMFSTSGWAHTNTTHPFILTPDYLTNAMIAVSRFKPGDPGTTGPAVPKNLDIMSLTRYLRDKTEKYKNVEIMQRSTNGRRVAIAEYTNDSRSVVEYIFELDGIAIDVYLSAKNSNYSRAGQVVAFNIIHTIRHAKKRGQRD